MFKDYYAILEVEPPVSEQELKSAYRKQCLKWHPDKNPDKDTTLIMQNIIEAYIYLKDTEARERYDQTYYQFKKDRKEKENSTSYENRKEENTQKQYEYEYDFSDEILKKWMNNAKEQAKKMKAEVIDEFKGATVESGKSIVNYFLYMFLPMLIGFLLIKTCNS